MMRRRNSQAPPTTVVPPSYASLLAAVATVPRREDNHEALYHEALCWTESYSGRQTIDAIAPVTLSVSGQCLHCTAANWDMSII